MKTQYTLLSYSSRNARRSFFLTLPHFRPPAPAPRSVSLTLFISLALERHREHAGTFVIVAITSIGQSADELMSHDGNYCRATQDDVRSFAKRVTTTTVISYVMNLHLVHVDSRLRCLHKYEKCVFTYYFNISHNFIKNRILQA